MFVRHLEKYVLRGYFDTDGSVVITNNNGTLYPRLEMKISPSPMQQQFIDILEQFNFRFGVYDIGKGKVRIQMNGLECLNNWFTTIGFSNRKHGDKTIKLLHKNYLSNVRSARLRSDNIPDMNELTS